MDSAAYRSPQKNVLLQGLEERQESQSMRNNLWQNRTEGNRDQESLRGGASSQEMQHSVFTPLCPGSAIHASSPHDLKVRIPWQCQCFGEPDCWGRGALPDLLLSVGRKGELGWWTEAMVWWQGTTWGPASNERRDIPLILGRNPFVLLNTAHPWRKAEVDMFISSRLHLPLYSLNILLLSFIHSVLPDLLWVWVVLGGLGHHPYPEGETSPAHMRHLLFFPYSCRVGWGLYGEGIWIWDETR